MKKFAALGLLMVMMVSMLAGCGQTTTSTDPQDTAVPTTQTAGSYDYLLK